MIERHMLILKKKGLAILYQVKGFVGKDLIVLNEKTRRTTHVVTTTGEIFPIKEIEPYK